MMQSDEIKKKLVRKTIDIDEELESAIIKMGKERNWSFSYMSYTLLQSAIREKLRKKPKNNA